MTARFSSPSSWNSPPEERFATFLDLKKHSAATGIVPGQMIVQAWRASQMKVDDSDSVLVLRFSQAPLGRKIDLVHVNVPETVESLPCRQ